ncbi:terminase large subunit from bacteriophage origin, partial [Escherichia coli EC1848]
SLVVFVFVGYKLRIFFIN